MHHSTYVSQSSFTSYEFGFKVQQNLGLLFTEQETKRKCTGASVCRQSSHGACQFDTV